ncbi:hypothetical protein TWF718_006565 [Orbilia javanica]|uniref:LysM domain-containing protein n=1 Tax=Orbilia javanica TaxID=47235 RepID=A0AAN8RD81_9PEZI
MASFLKSVSLLAFVSGGLAHIPYGGIQARGTIVSSVNRVGVPARGDISEGCNLWFTTYKDDTCDTILTASDISMEELINWNPSLEDGNCDDLIQPDTDYCVRMDPEPLLPPTRPTPPPIDNSVMTPSPIQPGMTRSCTNFHLVRGGQGCTDIIPLYPDLSIELLYQWNPAIGKRCNMMWAGTYICVSVSDMPSREPTITRPQSKPTPSPIGEGTTPNCQRWAYARTGDTCDTILSRNKDIDSTTDDLFRWNPSIGEDCSGLAELSYICILGPGTPTRATTTPALKGTPSPIASTGTTRNCKRWGFVRPGDDCQTIIDRNNLRSSITDLYFWNRSIRPDCSSLVEGNYICISGPLNPRHTTMATTTRTVRWTTTVRRTTTTIQNLTSTPSPVQPGTVEGCRKWAYIKDGQTCNDVVNRFEWLTFDMLIRWNPSIGAGCTSLWARTYVCVSA